ncbi:cytochrome P450 [Sulfitobacter sp. D35]|uniref:cytochrome P450 n=1 Tax=Sulfitobacter sp. D35 TaxID=3083252 RepID=UPI00296FF6A5|nr:cytochrome P450 [Sulfitobacter sp. D35]MDW4497092.1 cytochrome P450 [Sulfitobacter sp. D35]
MLPTPKLAHIPGPPAPPMIGHTLQIVRDPYGTQAQFIDRFGPVYKTHMLGRWRVNLCGPDAMEFVLLNRDGIFSNAGGWDALQRLFPGGLLLQDGEIHRKSRRIMTEAFRAGALRDYRRRMGDAVDTLLAGWPARQPFGFYDAIKDLTLRMGGAVFMGLPLDGALARHLNRAIRAEIRATVTPIRLPLPFTPMWRGVRGRRFLRETFRSLIDERRATGGEDFFSRMCLARDEEGAGWDEEELLDQFNLLIMAAHDTTATTLTAMVWALAAHPEWQARVAAEVSERDPARCDVDLAEMTDTALVFREALRLVAPVPFIPRLATEPFRWRGLHIPAGTSISLNPGFTMLSEDLYTDPQRFDPERFAPGRAEDRRHKFAWTPFGGGAHKCLGMHFAETQVKLFLAALLRRYRVSLVDAADPGWQRMPIPRPRGGLPVVLEPRLGTLRRAVKHAAG